jgi:hypothetical protein
MKSIRCFRAYLVPRMERFIRLPTALLLARVLLLPSNKTASNNRTTSGTVKLRSVKSIACQHAYNVKSVPNAEQGVVHTVDI